MDNKDIDIKNYLKYLRFFTLVKDLYVMERLIDVKSW
jgi:hypothetical protein